MNDNGSQTTENEAADTSMETVVKPKKRRGFAAMDPERVSEIASKGGKAAHRAGTAHQFTPEEARKAGKKGGTAARRRKGGGPIGV